MARYTGSVCRLCRRENQKLFLKGDRCMTEKCSFERRGYPPGQHGQGRIKFSEYGLQLREKQKKGKKKMKERGRGSVDIPHDVFLKMMRS